MWPCVCNQAAVDHLQEISGLSERESQVYLDDIVRRGHGTEKAVRYARTCLERKSGFLTLWGGPGNGKTHILQALVNEARRSHIRAVYVNLVDLIGWVQEAYNEGQAGEKTTYRKKVARMADVDFLMVDEFDKIKGSAWTDQFRADLFDKRYRKALDGLCLTVFAMNKSPWTIFDDAQEFLSRLRDGRFALEYNEQTVPIAAIVENTDKDIRPYLRPEEGEQ
jgi:DNA replication protein DnaC